MEKVCLCALLHVILIVSYSMFGNTETLPKPSSKQQSSSPPTQRYEQPTEFTTQVHPESREKFSLDVHKQKPAISENTNTTNINSSSNTINANNNNTEVEEEEPIYSDDFENYSSEDEKPPLPQKGAHEGKIVKTDQARLLFG